MNLNDQMDNLLGYVEGINDERDSVPILLKVRSLWAKIKAPGRRELAARRENETLRYQVDGLTYYGTVSRFGDGDIAEIFINSTKLDNSSDTNARDAAIAASLALQYGCPATVLQKALTRSASGTASGPLGKLLDLLIPHE